MSEDPALSVKIYDWNVYRIFRDSNENILKIILEKDNAFREYCFEGQAKWVGDERVVKA